MSDEVVQSALTAITFSGIKFFTGVSEALSLPVVSTGRSFSYYRRIFFSNQTKSEIIDSLKGQVIVDVGCGLTPYISDSMFQNCRREGIDFYGVDPKLADGFKFGSFDKLKARLSGAAGNVDPDALGLDKGIGKMADDLPFDDASVNLIMSNYLIYAWINDEEILESIFREFHRVLKPGGQVKIFPSRHKNSKAFKTDGLNEIMSSFDLKQRFFKGTKRMFIYPPAYVNTYTKR